MESTSTPTDRSWYITERWQQFEGEARANQLRIIAIGSFYLIHLWNHFSAQIDDQFHLLVTLLAMAWCLMAFTIHFALRARVFPAWLPYASTLGDVVLLTSVLCISTGARSPLVLGYFLIISLAALRFSLPLVRFATITALIGYICLLGCAKWPETFNLSGAIDQTVPRYHQLMTLAGIALGGIIIGQIVRRVRDMAQDYARRAVNNSDDVRV
ncbi:MAG: hypothetical protein WBF93_08540 [Pirellulales bacterium]